jgi:hypothetical protein
MTRRWPDSPPLRCTTWRDSSRSDRAGRPRQLVPHSSFATLHRYAGAKLTTVEGIAVTTIAQTLFDLPTRVSPWRLERATDDALLAQRLLVADLDERLRFYADSRRPGLPRIRPLVLERLEDGWTAPESELEARLIAVLAKVPNAPPMVRQAPLPWRSTRPGRVDLLLPAQRLIIEADGRRWHTRVDDFDKDKWRDNEAVAHGYRVLHFTWVHLGDLADDVLDVVDPYPARFRRRFMTDGCLRVDSVP